ncbi:hypothetical protein M4C38_25865 [Klebsiella pneumoniae]|jgi:hypothetical protein|uniref:hypothetical protein n=1 Tax=Klebsiella pneumoniae TaxID=573 RepID=UPI001D1976A7|nr:hypothetical protein [Klebsiella pneumoniae]MCM6330823.1 hypothetical protein [Klebsiella pneumoniae]MEA4541529.1 hypothetical protein [Klebsiella pneumoniae]
MTITETQKTAQLAADAAVSAAEAKQYMLEAEQGYQDTSAAAQQAQDAAGSALLSKQSAATSEENSLQYATEAGVARDEAVTAASNVSEIAETLPTNEQFTELQTSVDSITADPANAITSITIPALDFSLAIGSASFGMISSRLAGWQFTHGADASVTKMIDLPSHWSKMRISLIWANLVANTGDVSFSGLIQNWSAGESFNQTPSGGGIVAAANATPYIGIETQIALDLTVDPTRHTTIRVGRNGSSASDTLPTAMVLLAVRLTKVA